MVYLYCLSSRFRIRWSFSGKFHCFSDCISWLLKHKLHNDICFYRIIEYDYDDNSLLDETYIKAETWSFGTHLTECTMCDICIEGLSDFDTLLNCNYC